MSTKVNIEQNGIARTTNPAAVLNGQPVRAGFDDLGRQITRPYQVRDLLSTAFVSLTTGTKTEFIAAVAATYLDLIQISYANNSDAATVVTLTDESTTVLSIPVAANSAGNMNFTPPLPQSATGVAWYVDLPDITGTTITINGTFSKEI